MFTQFPLKISYSLLLKYVHIRGERRASRTHSLLSLSRFVVVSIRSQKNERPSLFLSFSLLLFKYYLVSSHRIHISSSFARETVFFGDAVTRESFTGAI